MSGPTNIADQDFDLARRLHYGEVLPGVAGERSTQSKFAGGRLGLRAQVVEERYDLLVERLRLFE